MTKAREIRDMSEEQIRLVWKEAAESLFRLRLQAQTEKLASPSEVRKQRRTIARCQTILVQRGLPVGGLPGEAAVAAPAMPQSKKPRAAGRGKGRKSSAGGA
ncbi:MAG: 50S ribosomal protein L29 [Planctomycetia bacterium]|nr:50S ribosomal protein L29 [Planctomycetia bacterium]